MTTHPPKETGARGSCQRGLGAPHLGVAKIEVDGLGMADVQDPIGLRREPCPHLQGW